MVKGLCSIDSMALYTLFLTIESNIIDLFYSSVISYTVISSIRMMYYKIRMIATQTLTLHMSKFTSYKRCYRLPHNCCSCGCHNLLLGKDCRAAQFNELSSKIRDKICIVHTKRLFFLRFYVTKKISFKSHHQ